MPKPHTFPTLFNDLKTVSISFLAKNGYLKPNHFQNGTITWSSNGIKTGSILIWVSTQPGRPYLELDYKCNGAPVKYKVQLVSAPSNLGKGVVWYFICPNTNKRCRKLYLADTYFYHRSAFRGCLYKTQTYSKKYRQLEKKFKFYFQKNDFFEELSAKHFKKHYAGKPTRRYSKLTLKLQVADRFC